MSNESYTLRGKNRGITINGTTNEQGVLMHEPVPDDDYEIECQGKSEVIEVYFIEDKNVYGVTPCKIRIPAGART